MKQLFANNRRALVIVVVLLLINSVMPSTVAGWVSNVPRSLVRSIVSRAAAPLHGLSTRIRGRNEEVASDLDAILKDRQRLEQQNIQLQEVLQRMHEQVRTLSGIRDRLELKASPLLTAVVRSVTPDRSHPTIDIDLGRRDGVAEGHVVIGGRDGVDLIGRISNVGPRAATVSLISAPRTHLEVRIVPPDAPEEDGKKESGVKIQLSWSVDRRAFESTIDLSKQERIRTGFQARLSDPRWPSRGFVVGTVTKVEKLPENPLLRRRVVVTPRTDPGRLNRVTLVLAPDVGTDQ
ncbi:MAG: hypothetical protein CMJ18_03275 [Phycisphaeraceae bacterium]|nr:hypothetical protein [Phycisphaeraceae bacterium]